MREQPRDASQQRRGGAQASCSKFLYWIKAARYAGRALAAEGRRRSCLPPRSRQPPAAQRARTASAPTEPRKQPDQPEAAPAGRLHDNGSRSHHDQAQATSSRATPNPRCHHAAHDPIPNRATRRRPDEARVAHVTGARHSAGASWLTFGGLGTPAHSPYRPSAQSPYQPETVPPLPLPTGLVLGWPNVRTTTAPVPSAPGF